VSEQPDTATDDTPETRTELLARVRRYARTVDLPIALDAVSWEISERAKRRAGSCHYDADTESVTIRLTWRAYRTHGWATFRDTVRHELIHAWEFQAHGESSHGPRFREKAEELDVEVHCERFTEPRLRATCTDEDCDWELGRHRASKTVRRPDRYGCGVCGTDYVVRHCDTGRIWTTPAEYERARTAIGDDW